MIGTGGFLSESLGTRNALSERTTDTGRLLGALRSLSESWGLARAKSLISYDSQTSTTPSIDLLRF